MKTDHFFRYLGGAIFALAFSLSLTSRGDEEATPSLGVTFSGIYAFGDSLSDTGNFFALTGIPPAAYGYFEGRYSNGIIWVEYLAEKMGLAPGSIANYAIGGATTGTDNENDDEYEDVEFFGLQDELDQFENHLAGRKADGDALYIVWAGANDFLIDPAAVAANPNAVIGNAVNNTMTAVQRLYDAGARHIMVVNMPDLGLTPYGSADPATNSALSAAFNQNLDGGLDVLKGLGIETIRLDSAGIIRAIATNPGEFGFTNVTDPFLPTGQGAGGNPSDYLFYDAVHPTTKGHSAVADEAFRVLGLAFPAGSGAEQPTDDGAEQPTDSWSSSYAKANTAYNDFAAFGLENLARAYYYYYRAIGDYNYYTATGLDAEANFAFNHGLGLFYYNAYYDVDPSSALFNYYTYLGYAYFSYFEGYGDTPSANYFFDAMIALALGA